MVSLNIGDVLILGVETLLLKLVVVPEHHPGRCSVPVPGLHETYEELGSLGSVEDGRQSFQAEPARVWSKDEQRAPRVPTKMAGSHQAW